MTATPAKVTEAAFRATLAFAQYKGIDEEVDIEEKITQLLIDMKSLCVEYGVDYQTVESKLGNLEKDVTSKKLNVNGYVIEANTDWDDHLTLTIDHESGSRVDRLEHDCSVSDEQWGDRFTTEQIEAECVE